MTEPYQLTATAAAAMIRARTLSCEELLRSCLGRIARRDPVVRAWLYLDTEAGLRRARELDKRSATAWAPTGALHGLPWGVKDVFDTKDMPTTQNSPIYPSLQQGRDAAAVAIVRQAGGLILGKTDTVEFASSGRRAVTQNPYRAGYTAGGSSSGSGAAVGDFHVPLAFGTQTGGSHIRPASFNGIYGMKPSWSLVSAEGVKRQCPTLDTVGWYGRCVDDLMLVAEALRAVPDAVPDAIGPKGLRVGLCRSPVWGEIEAAGEAALLDTAERLRAAGAIVTDLALPEPFEGLRSAHTNVFQGEGGIHFLPEYLEAPALLAPDLRTRVERPRAEMQARLLAAYTLADRCRVLFDGLFGAELDVVLTPSAKGEAPKGLESTGSPVFNANWTLLHVPCVGVPAGRGPMGLPVGVTLVGPRFGDARLLAIARGLAAVIDEDPGAGLRELCCSNGA